VRRDPSEGGAPLYRSSQTSRSALRRRCALSAPLAVFCSVHHVDVRQCHRCGADVEIRRRRAEQFSWASMGFHRGSLQVGLCTPTALTTSPHTLINSLSRARIPCLRRVLCPTGWRAWTSEPGSLCGLWEFNLHLWCMVFSLQCLEWSLAVLYTCMRAVPANSSCVCSASSVCICG